MREPLCATNAGVWKDIGVELLGGESKDALNVIECNNPSDVTKCCSKMFDLWLDRQPSASWRQLIQALKQVQLDRLANQFESKLKIPVPEPCLKPIASAGLFPISLIE